MGSSFSTPPPSRELYNIVKSCEKMLKDLDMEPIRFNRVKDRQREEQDEAMDKFERMQSRVNKCLQELRQAKMDAKDSGAGSSVWNFEPENKEARDRAVTRALASERIDKYSTEFDKGMTELESIWEQSKEEYEKDPEGVGAKHAETSDISFDQVLKLREKVIEMLHEQKKVIMNFGASHSKAEAKKHEQTAKYFSMQVNDLGELPDLDPESWVHYKKYVEKDNEINDALAVLDEKNQMLKERAQQVADHHAQATPLEEQLDKEMEKCRERSEEAVDRVSKLNAAIDGKGPGKICVYIMIVMGIVGIGYGLYCEGGGDSC